MSLGDGRNGNQNKLFENTYYSRTRFKDYDNKLALGFSFKSGMLIPEISKEKEGFSYEMIADIRITHTKANIMLERIKEFEKSIENGLTDPNIGFGINAGLGEIQSVLVLHVNENGGKSVTIGKVDKSGKYTEKVTFNFVEDFHYGLRWNNIDIMDVEKSYVKDIEYRQFCNVIEQFAIASTGAFAYSVADITRYDTRSILNKMNPIFDKLGIERNNGSNRGSRDNFFNNSENNGNKNSSHKSYDETMDDLPFEYED